MKVSCRKRKMEEETREREFSDHCHVAISFPCHSKAKGNIHLPLFLGNFESHDPAVRFSGSFAYLALGRRQSGKTRPEEGKSSTYRKGRKNRQRTKTLQGRLSL